MRIRNFDVALVIGSDDHGSVPDTLDACDHSLMANQFAHTVGFLILNYRLRFYGQFGTEAPLSGTLTSGSIETGR
jgi:hypothetical protein